MGICSSCLGRDRNRDVPNEDENTRLLFDDAHANQYGSFGEGNPGNIQADPQEVQRETEALQKVVAQTSNHLVDIFAMVPQTGPRVPSTNFSGHDARLLRYRDVLAKMSTQEDGTTKQRSIQSTPNASDGWVSEEEDAEEVKNFKPVKSEDVGPLLGGFADAESAMK
ncbi:hypothetical protein B7494_g7794 [Chlorociboria aeruginascens]|nr:hypothetical protein B7494_g7794 [Chlorociboria aeruginascens]